jgi:site-specific DNA-cytosine methylase
MIVIMREREGKSGGGKGFLLSDRSFTLATNNDQTVFGFSHTQGLDSQPTEEGTPTLRANGAGMAVNQSAVVRRLTPTECERLQGFPDGWTEGQADSTRYKQMGNAVAVPVVDWIVSNLVK